MVKNVRKSLYSALKNVNLFTPSHISFFFNSMQFTQIRFNAMYQWLISTVFFNIQKIINKILYFFLNHRQKCDRQKWDGRSFVRSHICRSINGRTFAYRHRQKCDPNYFNKKRHGKCNRKAKKLFQNYYNFLSSLYATQIFIFINEDISTSPRWNIQRWERRVLTIPKKKRDIFYKCVVKMLDLLWTKNIVSEGPI